MSTIVKPTITPVPAEVRAKLRVTPTKGTEAASSSSANGEACEKAKKLPPIKAPVGLAKGPDLKNCRSKVGSLNNIKHTPQMSGVIIPVKKLNWNAKSKIGSLENREHQPGGGKLKVESRKLEWKTTSKVQSLANVKHKPGGGNVKIFNEVYMEKSTTKSNAEKESSNEMADDFKNLSLKGSPNREAKR